MKKQEVNLKKALESLWKEPTADVYPKRYSTGGQILSTMASLIPGYGAIVSPFISIADQYRDTEIAKKEAQQAALNSRPTQMNTNIYGQMASGGYTTSKFKQYRTGGHMTGNDQLISENGVPSNNNAVASVQNNENAYTNNKQTYIYSDVLVNPETGNPFNVDSAKAVKKYKYADTDPEQRRALDFTMNRLSILNDTMRNMKDSVQKAFGGPPDPNNPYMPTVTNSAAGSMTTATVVPNIIPQQTVKLNTNLLAVPYGELPTPTERGIRVTEKYENTPTLNVKHDKSFTTSKSKSKERFREKAFGGPPDPVVPIVPTAKIARESTSYPINTFQKPYDHTDQMISTKPLGIDPNGLPYSRGINEDPRSNLPKLKTMDEIIGIAASGVTHVGGYDGSGSKFKSQQRFREKANGGLTSEDRGSDKKPYPSVASNDFAGGNRSYPIPTKADAIDALRLAGLHGRGDVRAKVYDKYPDLKKAYGGNPLSKMTNMATASVADALAFQGRNKPDTPLQAALDNNDLFFRQSEFNVLPNGKRGWEHHFDSSTFPLVQPWANVLDFSGSDNSTNTPTTQPAQPVTNVASPATNVTTPSTPPPTNTTTSGKPVYKKSFVQKNTEPSLDDASNIDLVKELDYAVMLDNPKPLTIDQRSNVAESQIQNQDPYANSNNNSLPGSKRTPFNYNAVAMGLKAVALGKSVADALEKPLVEKPMFTDYNASDRQMYGTNVDYTQARQDAMAASNLAANVNRAASSGFNQYQGRMQSTYGNLADQLGQISMNENLQRNQQAMQRGQYETAKAIDVKNTMYQNRVDNLQNMANAKLADQKLFSELSQIGTEFNQYQGYKEMLQNNKELSQATINQGLALIGSNYANFGFTKDFIDKIKTGQASVNELVQFMAATDQAKQTKG
jgi:hypothetical protein